MNRTRSMEIRALRQRMDEQPPPAPAGTSIREWFAGLVMASPELMKDVPLNERAKVAVQLADELTLALQAPRCPTQESMRAPSDKEMSAWEQSVGRADRQSRATVPELKKARPMSSLNFGEVMPPLSVSHPSMFPSARQALPAPTGYRFSDGDVTED